MLYASVTRSGAERDGRDVPGERALRSALQLVECDRALEPVGDHARSVHEEDPGVTAQAEGQESGIVGERVGLDERWSRRDVVLDVLEGELRAVLGAQLLEDGDRRPAGLAWTVPRLTEVQHHRLLRGERPRHPHPLPP